MFIVYVIQHTDTKTVYVGRTNDLKRRIREHNEASKQRSTHRKSGEWILIYAEAYHSKTDAREREARLKQHGRAKQELFKRTQLSRL